MSERIESLTDEQLERVWDACQILTNGARLVRGDTRGELILLAADISIERSRRAAVVNQEQSA